MLNITIRIREFNAYNCILIGRGRRRPTTDDEQDKNFVLNVSSWLKMDKQFGTNNNKMHSTSPTPHCFIHAQKKLYFWCN